MYTFAIKENVYSVGVLNPNLRVFDIVMKTEFGTTYNAYLVRGAEKTALIDASHLKFFDYYLANVQEICGIDEIDYIVMNHNEPDHSGTVAKLLKLNPKIEVYASKAGTIYLKNITNDPAIKLHAVKDGDTLDLGGKTLHFKPAPFLHWPDTMFTWLAEDRMLFTCDFLGAHYCEPLLLDTKKVDKDAYLEAFHVYYEAIFAPFKPYVLKGLDIVTALDPDLVATSHGLIVSKNGLLPELMARYREWSTPAARERKSIPIFYCSAYGNTELLAFAIADGLREALPDAEINTYDIIKHDPDELGVKLNESDAFLIGSPTLNKDAVPPVWQLLSRIDAINIQKRPAAVFGSYGWSGEGVPALVSRLQALKVKVSEDTPRAVFIPSEEELANARAFGKSFGEAL